MSTGMKRGDIYYAELDPVVGSEQGGNRPVLIIQNNIGNQHSPTVIIAPITSRRNTESQPTHCLLTPRAGLKHSSIVLMEQIRTIDKSRLGNYINSIGTQTLLEIDHALKISVGLK